MSVFLISSRKVQPVEQSAKRRGRRRRRWFAIQWRILVGGLLIALLATLLPTVGLQPVFFLLLPVFAMIIVVSIANVLSHRVKRNLLLTAFVSLLYFSAITGWELLTHPVSTLEYIVVGTTLAVAVLLEPLRNWLQKSLEQRFHLNDDEAIKAVETFTSTLREEIDLDRVRDGLLTVVQQIIQPESVAIWVRKTTQSGEDQSESRASHVLKLYETSPEEIIIADDDPIIPFLLLPLVAGKALQFVEQGIDEERPVALAREQRLEARETEHFAPLIMRLHQSIAVEEQAFSRRYHRFVLLITCTGHHPKRHTGCPQFDRAAGSLTKRRFVTGIGKAHSPI